MISSLESQLNSSFFYFLTAIIVLIILKLLLLPPLLIPLPILLLLLLIFLFRFLLLLLLPLLPLILIFLFLLLFLLLLIRLLLVLISFHPTSIPKLWNCTIGLHISFPLNMTGSENSNAFLENVHPVKIFLLSSRYYHLRCIAGADSSGQLHPIPGILNLKGSSVIYFPQLHGVFLRITWEHVPGLAKFEPVCIIMQFGSLLRPDALPTINPTHWPELTTALGSCAPRVGWRGLNLAVWFENLGDISQTKYNQ